MPKSEKTRPTTPIQITIAAPPAPTPALPPPPQTMPELPKLDEVTPDLTLPVVPKFTAKSAPKPTPTPTPTPQPAVESQQSADVSSPAPAPHPAPAAPAAASQDDVYAAQVRAYLESIKHYPTSKEARLQRPRGTVDVWFILDRAGGVKEAGVEESSGSLILDGAALTTVRGASYPAFPAEAFKGDATHRFTVHLNYTLT
jgi:protein TonB